MPLNFLDTFPREIRDQIYTYALSSPSGSIDLFPWIFACPAPDPRALHFNPRQNLIGGESGPINLSLLKTCRQIRRECKAIIWEHNRLRIREESKLSQRLTRYTSRHTSLVKFRRIQHIKIQLEVLDWDELEWMHQSLKAFVILVHEGSLESIQLISTSDRNRQPKEFHALRNLKMHGEQLDGRWYRAASILGDQFARQGIFAINTGWPRVAHSGTQNWLRETLLDPDQILLLLHEMHKIFGGELYVDGLMCYKNHAKVAEGYRLNPRDGEITIWPGRRDASQQIVGSQIRAIIPGNAE